MALKGRRYQAGLAAHDERLVVLLVFGSLDISKVDVFSASRGTRPPTEQRNRSWLKAL
jgi:hypothetical protein